MIIRPVFPRLQRGKLIADGLMAAVLFHEGSGGVAYDLTNRGHDLTLASSHTWVGSPYGHVLQSSTDPATFSPITLAGDFTTTAFVYIDDVSASPGNCVITDITAGYYYHWLFQANNWYIRNSGGWKNSTITGYGGAWYRFTTVRIGSTVYFWVDAKLKSSGSWNTATCYPDGIGNQSVSYEFHGMISDLRFYNRALSQPEIALIASGLG